MDEYQILADVYDILNPKAEILKQRPFFEELIGTHKVEQVLDCACGTGLHLQLFHEIGLTCFGSDISEDMLRIARENTDGLGIELKKEDFRTLSESWDMQVGMVTCLTTSLPYMQTDEDVVTALVSMYDRLNTGGILVITNGITDSLLDSKPRFIPARENFDDGFYFVCEYHEEKTMTFNIVYVHQTENGMEHKFTYTTYNAMRRSTLERAFTQTPFKNISYYGDYDFSEYSKDTSNTLIVVAQK